MAWIESHQSLARHPKTLRLARALGRDVPTVIGHLHLLWWWALDYAPSGSLAEVSNEEVAAACQYRGDPGRLAGALTAAGFLEEGRRLHDWEEYTGRLLARRLANTERMRRVRASQAASIN
jgi:hypothetical protein